MGIPQPSAFPLCVLTLVLISIGLFPAVRSLDDNFLVLPSDRDNSDDRLCPSSLDQVSCPVKCFTTDPVCGEDGVTYWCGCADAHCAGTRVTKLGFCQVGSGGAVRVSGQALMLVHIVWLILLAFLVLFGLL